MRRGFTVHSGQWIAYGDAKGRGWAQPDHYIVFPASVLLIECKLSETAKGYFQIDYIYRPLLSHIYGLPVVGVQMYQNKRYAKGVPVVESLEELLLLDSNETFSFHWRG